MNHQISANVTRSVLTGGGEMGARIRAHDWSATPLGPVECWPQSLRSVVSMLLPSRAQIILFWGSDFTVLYNDAYRPVFGAKHPDAVGLPGREAWSEIWDEMLHDLLAGVMRTGEAFWAKDLLFVIERHGFGEETYFDVSYDPVRIESGEVGGVYCIVTETTERVVAARRMALLKDLAAQQTLARTTQDACAIAIETLTNHRQDVVFAFAYLDGQLQACTPGAQKALDRTPSAFVHTLDIASPAGPGPSGRIVLGLNPRCPFDADCRSFIGLVAHQFGAAVASAHAYEEEKRRAETLAEIDRAKTMFFSNISHELRTPLTLILGPVEDMLAERDAPGADRERLELVHRNSLRLLKLVNSLLEFSRIEAGRVQASFDPTDLAALTSDLASAFRSAIERAGMELVVDCPPLGEPVCVDRDMWERIVLNLLSNAFKYTLHGRITVALRRHDGAVTLTVTDTGVGISARELPRVFERFHRIDGVHGRAHEGSGIGLALVRELARLHGGTATVESILNAGSTFAVSVPLGHARLSDGVRQAPTIRRMAALGPSPYVAEALRWLPDGAATTDVGGAHAFLPALRRTEAAGVPRARILIADDNADMRDYLSRVLRAQYDVESVGDGRAALAAARRDVPDLVLADVMMPVMDGFTLLRELRGDAALRTMPVLLLSARAGEEARVEGWEAGADDYLVKPFSARELVARVGTQLEMARIRRDAERVVRQSEQRLRADLDAMTRLQRLGTLFVIQDNLEPVLGEIVDAAMAIAQADFGNIQLLDPLTGALRLAAQRGFETWWVEYWDSVAASRGACARAMELGERVIVEDVTTSPIFVGTPALDLQLRAGVRAVQSTPLVSRSGRPLGMFSTHYRQPHRPDDRALRLLDLLARQAADIVDRACSEAALRDSEERLREADRRKDEFLATLAHELRNPLAPIRTGLELIRLGGSTPASVERVRGIMERQIGHMVRLIDDLLDISRITAGKIQLQRQLVPLSELVDGAVEATRVFVTERRVALAVRIPDTPCLLDVDRTRFVQILSNLLHNAVKFSRPAGRIEVAADVMAASSGAERHELVLTVADSGIGIAPELLPRVFDLFSQGDGMAGPGQGGLGIGLALVRRLVELHGGQVEAHSEGLGRGTQIVIRLPVSDVTSPSIFAVPSGEARTVDCRVLVVDDNDDAAQTLAQLVTTLGGEARVANDGVAALSSLADFEPDIVLLDIGMPGMDGYETCRRLRETPDGGNLVVVAITGWGQDDDKQRAADAGFDLHLTKPADPVAVQQLLADFERMQTSRSALAC